MGRGVRLGANRGGQVACAKFRRVGNNVGQKTLEPQKEGQRARMRVCQGNKPTLCGRRGVQALPDCKGAYTAAFLSRCPCCHRSQVR